MSETQQAGHSAVAGQVERGVRPLVEKLRERRQAVAWSRGQDTDYPTKWEPDALCQQAADEIDRLSAAPMWRPIATAPRDGKENVLLYDGKIVSAGGWTTDLDCGAEYEGQLGMFGWWWIDGGNCEPTHWMPLPAAPEGA
jgi:Protein of unknown function (DUF551)